MSIESFIVACVTGFVFYKLFKQFDRIEQKLDQIKEHEMRTVWQVWDNRSIDRPPYQLYPPAWRIVSAEMAARLYTEGYTGATSGQSASLDDMIKTAKAMPKVQPVSIVGEYSEVMEWLWKNQIMLEPVGKTIMDGSVKVFTRSTFSGAIGLYRSLKERHGHRVLLVNMGSLLEVDFVKLEQACQPNPQFIVDEL